MAHRQFVQGRVEAWVDSGGESSVGCSTEALHHDGSVDLEQIDEDRLKSMEPINVADHSEPCNGAVDEPGSTGVQSQNDQETLLSALASAMGDDLIVDDAGALNSLTSSSPLFAREASIRDASPVDWTPSDDYITGYSILNSNLERLLARRVQELVQQLESHRAQNEHLWSLVNAEVQVTEVRNMIERLQMAGAEVAILRRERKVVDICLEAMKAENQRLCRLYALNGCAFARICQLPSDVLQLVYAKMPQCTRLDHPVCWRNLYGLDDCGSPLPQGLQGSGCDPTLNIYRPYAEGGTRMGEPDVLNQEIYNSARQEWPVPLEGLRASDSTEDTP